MIDFKNAEFLKLKPVDAKAYSDMITPMFVPGEEIISTFVRPFDLSKATTGGGCLEVYRTVEDAESRNSYLAAFDGTALDSGSHTVVGTIVVRTSCKMTASQQDELEAEIISALLPIEE